jgi:hypothetical protein
MYAPRERTANDGDGEPAGRVCIGADPPAGVINEEAHHARERESSGEVRVTSTLIMNGYALCAAIVAIAMLVIADRFRSARVGGTDIAVAVFAGALWPLLLVGGLQVLAYMYVVRIRARSVRRSTLPATDSPGVVRTLVNS